MRVRSWIGAGLVVIATCAVIFCGVTWFSSPPEPVTQDWPDPIEVTHNGRVSRPEPQVRRRFDGSWRGVSGTYAVAVELRDGVGYCVVARKRRFVVTLTSVNRNDHMEFYLVEEESGDDMFGWFAHLAQPNRLVVHQIFNWQADPTKLWPVVPFDLLRQGE